MITAKFKVMSRFNYTSGDEARTNVNLDPVLGDDDPESENSKFWEAAPGGGISLGGARREVVDSALMEPGTEFIVEFRRAKD